MSEQVPLCLTIGSSDSSGGAGIQGDIKAYASVGCYAATVVVGVTAQNTQGVASRWDVPLSAVTDQLDTVMADMRIAAVKVGTTWSAELLRALGPYLRRFAGDGVPVVFDPVMVTASGAWLTSSPEINTVIAECVLPNCVIVTPNRGEAEFLSVLPEGTRSQMELATTIVGIGARAVVVTAGPGDQGDWFFDGSCHIPLAHQRHSNGADHGVGCAHSTVIAGLLAQGWPLVSAVREAGVRASASVACGHLHAGRGAHPIDILDLPTRGARYETARGTCDGGSARPGMTPTSSAGRAGLA